MNDTKADRDRVGAISNDAIGTRSFGTSIAVGGGNSRLGRTQFLTMNDQSVDRTLSKAHSTLRDVLRALSLSDNIYTRSCELLKYLDEAGKLRSRTGPAWILAVVYMACRQERAGRTIGELVRASPTVKEAEIARNYWRLDKLVAGASLNHQATGSQSTDNLVVRFCSRLGVPAAELAAEHVASEASRFGLVGAKAPSVIAAAAVFVVAQLLDLPNKPTLEAVTEVAQAKLAAVRQVYLALRQPIGRLLPMTFQVKLPAGLEGLP